MKTYPDEVKAQVIAEWQLGTPKAAIARKFNVSRSYVQQVTRYQEPVLSIQKREDLGQLVYDYLAEGLKTLRLQAAAMGDTEWFKGQAGAQHLIHGTLADKLVIIFGGVERGAAGDTDS